MNRHNGDRQQQDRGLPLVGGDESDDERGAGVSPAFAPRRRG